jgi:chemotaxis protein CheZ
MNAAIDSMRLKYAPLVKALTVALDRDDEPALFQALDAMLRQREAGVLCGLGAVTHDIESALARFCDETRLTDLAEKEVPDARMRLDHVLKMTDKAAHHTMDLVEQAYAPAERTSRQVTQLSTLWREFRADTASLAMNGHEDLRRLMDAFLEHARSDADYVQGKLKEMILAQGYQDLSGQIIRGVMQLIVELETALGSLMQLSRGQARGGSAARIETAGGGAQGYGPVVPRVNDTNVVNGQDDIDALLSNLNI